MTDTYIDENISQLERLLTKANDKQKAKLEARLRAMLKPRYARRRIGTSFVEEDEDMFNNVPV